MLFGTIIVDYSVTVYTKHPNFSVEGPKFLSFKKFGSFICYESLKG